MEVDKNLKNIRIKSPEDIRSSAEAFRDIVKKLVNMRIAASHNIAKNEALVDVEGQLIATEVFGWEGKNDWLGSAYLALESPITMACRYESEPFWINEKGVYTRIPIRFWMKLISRNSAREPKPLRRLLCRFICLSVRLAQSASILLMRKLQTYQRLMKILAWNWGFMRVPLFVHICMFCRAFRYCQEVQNFLSAKWSACVGLQWVKPILKSV